MSLAEFIPSLSRGSGCSRKTTGTSCAKGRPNNHMPKATKLHRISPAILQRTRDFRHPLTPTENIVWQAVRRRQLGFKIRRQHPIDRFVADFYCAEARLVIEIDGYSHALSDQADYDAARTRWLEEREYKVIRFTAQQVEEDLAGVVDGIRGACEERAGSNRTA